MQEAISLVMLVLILLIACAFALTGLAAALRTIELATANLIRAGADLMAKTILLLLVIAVLTGPALASFLTWRAVRPCEAHHAVRVLDSLTQKTLP